MSLDKPLIDDVGTEIFALAAKIFPFCRSITGNGVRQTLREVGAHIPLQIHEVPTGTPGSRLDHSARMEHSRRLDQERTRRKDRRFQPIQPACHELQRAGAAAHVARRTEEAHLYAAGSAGLDPLSDVLLRGELGLLHAPPAVRGAARRDLRSLDRLQPGERPSHAMANISTRARPRTSFCSPPTSAIPRSRTTIARASRC